MVTVTETTLLCENKAEKKSVPVSRKVAMYIHQGEVIGKVGWSECLKVHFIQELEDL